MVYAPLEEAYFDILMKCGYESEEVTSPQELSDPDRHDRDIPPISHDYVLETHEELFPGLPRYTPSEIADDPEAYQCDAFDQEIQRLNDGYPSERLHEYYPALGSKER